MVLLIAEKLFAIARQRTKLKKIGQREGRRKVYMDRGDIEMKTNTVVADAVKL